MNRRANSALAAIAALMLWAGAAAAQEVAPPADAGGVPALTFDKQAKPVADLAELLPADAVGFGSWSGQDAIHEAYLKSDFRKFWDEPSLAAIRKEISDFLGGQLKKMEKDLGGGGGDGDMSAMAMAAYNGMWEMWKLGFRRPLGVAFICPPGTKKESLEHAGPLPLMALMIDLGEKEADQKLFADKIYRPLMGLMMKLGDGEGGKTATVEHQGIKLHQRKLAEDETSPTLTWAVYRNIFILAFSEQVARQVIDAATGKSPRLSEAKPYVAIREKWGPGSPLTRSYVNVARVGQLIAMVGSDEDSKAEVARTLTALGLDQAHYGGSIRYVDKAVVANRYIAAPAKEGVLFPFTAKPLTEAEMAMVPADALAGFVVRATPSQLYAYAKQRVKMAEPPADPAAAKGTVDKIVESAKDLAVTAALGQFADVGGFIIYQNDANPLDKMIEEMNPMRFMFGGGRSAGPDKPADAKAPFDALAEYGQPVHVVFRWKVVDLDKAKPAGANTAAVIGSKLLGCVELDLAKLPVAQKYQDKDLAVEFMRDEQDGQVAWAFQGDSIVVSNTIRGVLKALAAKGEAAAVKSEPVQRYAAQRPKEVVLFAYADAPRVGKALFQMAKTGLDGAKGEVDFPIKTSPNPEALAAAMTPMVITASADAGGVLITEVGSMSMTGWPIVAMPAGTMGVPVMFMMGGFGAHGHVVEHAVEAEGDPTTQPAGGKTPARPVKPPPADDF